MCVYLILGKNIAVCHQKKTITTLFSEMTNATDSIEDIIEYFGALDFDDDNRGLKQLVIMFKQHKAAGLDEKLDEKTKREIMLSELKVFDKVIGQRMAEESFWWPPSKDAQFSHPEVLRWIMTRWFLSAKTMDDLPSWYQQACKLGDKTQRSFREHVKETIKIVES